MNKKSQKRLIKISKRLFHIPVGKNKHFSFVLDKNKLVAIGYNDGYKTHPQAQLLGYRFCAIHSELSAILKCKKYIDFKHLTIVNIRLCKNKTVGMSMPCEVCQELIKKFGKIYYTNYNGDFIQLK